MLFQHALQKGLEEAVAGDILPAVVCPRLANKKLARYTMWPPLKADDSVNEMRPPRYTVANVMTNSLTQ